MCTRWNNEIIFRTYLQSKNEITLLTDTEVTTSLSQKITAARDLIKPRPRWAQRQISAQRPRRPQLIFIAERPQSKLGPHTLWTSSATITYPNRRSVSTLLRRKRTRTASSWRPTLSLTGMIMFWSADGTLCWTRDSWFVSLIFVFVADMPWKTVAIIGF